MTTPLPGRTAANDQRIMSTPYAQLTPRQIDYADKYGLTLQVIDPTGTAASSQSAPPAPVSAPVSSPTPTPVQDKPDVDPNQALVDYYKQRDAQDAADRAAGQQRQRDDAFAAAASLLTDYGLGSLTDTVRQWAQADLSASEIALKLRDTKEFKDEYGGVLDARKKAGLPAVSVSDILGYRKRAAELFQAAGLPQGFHDDKSDYDKFIAGDVSLAELSDRINLAAQAAFKAPKEARDALAEWGMTPGDMTAFWLNPDTAQPLLERKFAAAQLAGASKRSGFGSLSEAEASGLADVGVTQDQAQTGFNQLANSGELMTALDAGEQTFGRDEQIGATFGTNPNAARRIAQQTRRRQAQFEAGGSFAAGQGGVTGLAAPR